jgi:hypothetical protein
LGSFTPGTVHAALHHNSERCEALLHIQAL